MSRRLRDFIGRLATLVDAEPDGEPVLSEGAALLSDLVGIDDWLPAEYARVDPQGYRQYLLYCDARSRFSVVSFVWGPGQGTPIHDHCTWGLVGVLRGAELSTRYAYATDGTFGPCSPSVCLEMGMIDTLSPSLGDIHQVANARDDEPSVSIHVYGANIGEVKRNSYDPTGVKSSFVSGYSNSFLPNLWS